MHHRRSYRIVCGSGCVESLRKREAANQAKPVIDAIRLEDRILYSATPMMLLDDGATGNDPQLDQAALDAIDETLLALFANSTGANGIDVPRISAVCLYLSGDSECRSKQSECSRHAGDLSVALRRMLTRCSRRSTLPIEAELGPVTGAERNSTTVAADSSDLLLNERRGIAGTIATEPLNDGFDSDKHATTSNVPGQLDLDNSVQNVLLDVGATHATDGVSGASTFLPISLSNDAISGLASESLSIPFLPSSVSDDASSGVGPDDSAGPDDDDDRSSLLTKERRNIQDSIMPMGY